MPGTGAYRGSAPARTLEPAKRLETTPESNAAAVQLLESVSARFQRNPRCPIMPTSLDEEIDGDLRRVAGDARIAMSILALAPTYGLSVMIYEANSGYIDFGRAQPSRHS